MKQNEDINLGFGDGVKYDFLTEEQMKEKPGYVYDIEGQTPNMVDVSSMLDNITSVLEYMYNSDISKMREENFEDYTKHMEEKFPTFADEFYAVFQKLISGEDITPLLGMLAMIEKIKRGDCSFEDGEKQVGEHLANRYVMPALNKNK